MARFFRDEAGSCEFDHELRFPVEEESCTPQVVLGDISVTLRIY